MLFNEMDQVGVVVQRSVRPPTDLEFNSPARGYIA